MNTMNTTPSTESFVPSVDNQRKLRDAFGCFATGVTVVTAMSEDGVVGITANSFSSVSMDPPLVLWSPSKGSRRFQSFLDAEHYAIHILAADQEDICWSSAKDAGALRDLDLATNQEGVPVIEGCLARFECTRTSVYEGGDHAIILGEVKRAVMREDGDALAFFRGKMGAFQAK